MVVDLFVAAMAYSFTVLVGGARGAEDDTAASLNSVLLSNLIITTKRLYAIRRCTACCDSTECYVLPRTSYTLGFSQGLCVCRRRGPIAARGRARVRFLQDLEAAHRLALQEGAITTSSPEELHNSHAQKLQKPLGQRCAPSS